jgi:hypothetical protein
MAAPPAGGASPALPSDKDAFKADMRSSRMKLTNTLHEKIFGEWQKIAVKACDDDVRAYWVCRQEHGLAVVFKCREENDRMQKCIADFTRDEDAFERYKITRMDQMSDSFERHKAAKAAAAAAGTGPAS